MSIHKYWDVDEREYGFQKYTLTLYQTFPLFDSRRQLALRLFGSTINPEKHKKVPFYMVNFIGGSGDLRGYQNNRFSDLDAVVGNIEYRYPIWDLGLNNNLMMDWVWFYDVGMVSKKIEDNFNFKKLRSDYGIGLLVHNDMGAIIRIDLSKSVEELRVDIKFGKDF